MLDIKEQVRVEGQLEGFLTPNQGVQEAGGLGVK